MYIKKYLNAPSGASTAAPVIVVLGFGATVGYHRLMIILLAQVFVSAARAAQRERKTNTTHTPHVVPHTNIEQQWHQHRSQMGPIWPRGVARCTRKSTRI